MVSIQEESTGVSNGNKESTSSPSDTSLIEDAELNVKKKSKTNGSNEKGDGLANAQLAEKDLNNNYVDCADHTVGDEELYAQAVPLSLTQSSIRQTNGASSPGALPMPTSLPIANQMIAGDQTAMAMEQQFFMHQLMAMQQHQASMPYYYNWMSPYPYNYDYAAKSNVYHQGSMTELHGLSQSLANMGLQEMLPNKSNVHQRPPPLSMTQTSPQNNSSSTDMYWHYNPGPELYSRKVFVGGLPIDVDEDELNATFSQFGPLVVDWPHKTESKTYFPPKGYVFLIFEHESSVQALVSKCYTDDEKLFLYVSSPTMKQKPVQIRPWRLADADYVVEATMALDPRKTVFVGGVPRPLKAVELAHIMDRLYGGVCYAGIDTDPELKYPKGAGRVSFNNQQSYIAAISARFVQLNHGEVEKRVEVKPYVLDDQMCDECLGQRCGMRYAPFFCPHVACLQYFCEHCWSVIHSRVGRDFHKPLVKEGGETSSSSRSSANHQPPPVSSRRKDFLDY